MPCFVGDRKKYYRDLMKVWSRISSVYPGWSLEEIKSLTPRERENWARVTTARMVKNA